MKKTTALCFAIILVLTVFLSTAQAAPSYDGEIASNAVMLLDATTGEVLFEKNADEQIRPASTTKIMTCIVALENAALDDVVTIGPEGDWTGSGYSLLGTKNGEEITLKDLLYGMMLVSGNDAAAAIAKYVGGSEDGFAEMMNDTASRIGMTSSHFVNPHGTDVDNHYVTARDMSILTLYAMKNETFMDIVGRSEYSMPETNANPARTVLNTNKLLFQDDPEYYPYANGIKTGSTPKAFRCLVSSAKKGDTQLVCLVYGDETESGTERWPLSRHLFDYGLINFRTVDIQSLMDNAEPVSVPVQNSSEGESATLKLSVFNTGEAYKTLETAVADSIEENGLQSDIELYGGDTLSAPLSAGQEVGMITYRNAATGDVVCQGQLVSSRDVAGMVGDGIDSAPTAQQNPADPNPETSGTVNVDNGMGAAWIYIVAAIVLAAVAAALVIVLIRINKNARRRRRRAVRRSR